VFVFHTFALRGHRVRRGEAMADRRSGIAALRRYARGMTTKIAVSLPDELVAAARQAVSEGRSASVSAFVAQALKEQARYQDLAGLLAEMAAEAGSPTDRDRAWARDVLGLD
jgi:Arc/MetJ-type ribon-helix-helix transcriptional regulator